MFPIVKQRFLSCAFALATALAASLSPTFAFAQDANVHQVYEAVQAGRLKDAEAMMVQVLRDHPNSAKAHYVAAEVYAKDGRFDIARRELARAEQIDPSLSFAKPESVRALRAAVEVDHGILQGGQVGTGAAHGAREGVSWTWIVVLGAAVLGAAALFSARRRAASQTTLNPAAASPLQSGFPPAGSAAQYPGAPVAASPPAGGLGSGLVGALATGAAMGAGVVASEAIAHRLMGDHTQQPPPDVLASGISPPLADAGLRQVDPDFGVQDSGSWDDNAGASWDNADLGGDVGGDDWT